LAWDWVEGMAAGLVILIVALTALALRDFMVAHGINRVQVGVVSMLYDHSLLPAAANA